MLLSLKGNQILVCIANTGRVAIDPLFQEVFSLLELSLSSLLVDNFDELESGLNRILDDSGPILKQSLAQVTQAVAIDNLADIVAGLSSVKRHLKDIQEQTITVQDKVGQLKLGLGEKVELMF